MIRRKTKALRSLQLKIKLMNTRSIWLISSNFKTKHLLLFVPILLKKMRKRLRIRKKKKVMTKMKGKSMKKRLLCSKNSRTIK